MNYTYITCYELPLSNTNIPPMRQGQAAFNTNCCQACNPFTHSPHVRAKPAWAEVNPPDISLGTMGAHS